MVDSPGARKHRRRRTHSKRRLRERQREKFFRSYGLQGCLVLVVVSLIPAWYMLTRGAPQLPLPPQDILKSQAHLGDIKKLLQQVRLDGQLDKPHPFEFRLSSRDMEVGLTTEGDAVDKLRSKAIEVVSARFLNGQIEVVATGPQTAGSGKVKVMLTPTVADGMLKFQTAGIGAAKDETADESLAQDVGSALEQLVYVSTVKYHTVKTEGNSLILTGDSAERSH